MAVKRVDLFAKAGAPSLNISGENGLLSGMGSKFRWWIDEDVTTFHHLVEVITVSNFYRLTIQITQFYRISNCQIISSPESDKLIAFNLLKSSIRFNNSWQISWFWCHSGTPPCFFPPESPFQTLTRYLLMMLPIWSTLINPPPRETRRMFIEFQDCHKRVNRSICRVSFCFVFIVISKN